MEKTAIGPAIEILIKALCCCGRWMHSLSIAPSLLSPREEVILTQGKERRKGAKSWPTDCVCVFFDFLSHCMQPEGLWQRLAFAPRGQQPIFPPLSLNPAPTICGSYRGYTISFPPYPPKKRAMQGKTEQSKSKIRSSHTILL